MAFTFLLTLSSWCAMHMLFHVCCCYKPAMVWSMRMVHSIPYVFATGIA